MVKLGSYYPFSYFLHECCFKLWYTLNTSLAPSDVQIQYKFRSMSDNTVYARFVAGASICEKNYRPGY